MAVSSVLVPKAQGLWSHESLSIDHLHCQPLPPLTPTPPSSPSPIKSLGVVAAAITRCEAPSLSLSLNQPRLSRCRHGCAGLPRATGDLRSKSPMAAHDYQSMSLATVRPIEVADVGGKAHHLRSKPRTALCTQKSKLRREITMEKGREKHGDQRGGRSAVVVTARGVGSMVAMAEARCRGSWPWKVVWGGVVGWVARWGSWMMGDLVFPKL
ncbi:hypothetical protein NL676_007975 [Syzygium grande]|nr:hypothetical protein NL676_007975 [Syzygium grande]